MSIGDNVEYGLGSPRSRARSAAAAPARRSSSCASPATRSARPPSSPAASASVSRSPARSSTGPKVLLLDEPLGALDLQAAPGDAGRAQAHPGRRRHHLRLRHARPGGGADHERPPGGVQPRADRAGRPARRGLRAPGEHVRGRLRRRLEPARARRPPLHGPAREGAPRRERRETGLHVEHGRIRDVAYAGMVTRYVVELDAGGELQVVRQNLETSSAEALEQSGPARSGSVGARSTPTRSRTRRSDEGSLDGGLRDRRGAVAGGGRLRRRRLVQLVEERRGQGAQRAPRRSRSSARARARST